ncbi:hypothetical protein HZH68_009620 [Vespula germanica]|uniref:Uncharacterized protein n=1 Tax=Vespula germanica TaxID=30212 RepID=A0A834N4K6_VESGE|nr:hypothetical protein HZH68_009620 [Vespula germanica]
MKIIKKLIYVSKIIIHHHHHRHDHHHQITHSYFLFVSDLPEQFTLAVVGCLVRSSLNTRSGTSGISYQKLSSIELQEEEEEEEAEEEGDGKEEEEEEEKEEHEHGGIVSPG